MIEIEVIDEDRRLLEILGFNPKTFPFEQLTQTGFCYYRQGTYGYQNENQEIEFPDEINNFFLVNPGSKIFVLNDYVMIVTRSSSRNRLPGSVKMSQSRFTTIQGSIQVSMLLRSDLVFINENGHYLSILSDKVTLLNDGTPKNTIYHFNDEIDPRRIKKLIPFDTGAFILEGMSVGYLDQSDINQPIITWLTDCNFIKQMYMSKGRATENETSSMNSLLLLTFDDELLVSCFCHEDGTPDSPNDNYQIIPHKTKDNKGYIKIYPLVDLGRKIKKLVLTEGIIFIIGLQGNLYSLDRMYLEIIMLGNKLHVTSLETKRPVHQLMTVPVSKILGEIPDRVCISKYQPDDIKHYLKLLDNNISDLIIEPSCSGKCNKALIVKTNGHVQFYSIDELSRDSTQIF